jgi:hypothetical protein
MAPFEFLYGRPCRTPLSWDRLEDRVLVGPEAIQEMEEQMKTIRQRKRMIDRRVMLMRTESTIVTRSAIESSYGLNRIRVRSSLEKGAKLSPRFVGPFEIVEGKRPVAYRLALPDSLRLMHDVFHVSV